MPAATNAPTSEPATSAAVETEPGTTAPEEPPAELVTGGGTIASTTLSPPLLVDVPDGIDVEVFELRRLWVLEFPESGGSITFVGLYDGTSGLADPASEQPLPEGANPSGIYLETVRQQGPLDAWLAEHPRLTLAGAGTAAVGGVEGQQSDLTVVEPYASPACATPECVVLFGFEELAQDEYTGAYAVSPSNPTRVVAVDIEQNGEPLLIFLEAPPEEAEAFFSQAEDILSTVRVATPPEFVPAEVVLAEVAGSGISGVATVSDADDDSPLDNTDVVVEVESAPGTLGAILAYGSCDAYDQATSRPLEDVVDDSSTTRLANTKPESLSTGDTVIVVLAEPGANDAPVACGLIAAAS